MSVVSGPIVLKFGGELIEDAARLEAVASAIERIGRAGVPLVLVHGGGKEIDAALETAGIKKRQVDGLRITDAATLDIVVAVLAGVINTRLVGALNRVGVAGVGLTGVDAGCGLSRLAPPHVAAVGGHKVDLGRVGVPVDTADVRLIETLVRDRYVPVIASIGVDPNGSLLNVNADSFAGHLAARLRVKRLIIAGTTAGVLRADGTTVPVLDSAAVGRLVGEGTVTAGMIAKLEACEHALARGVEDVVIVDGTDGPALVGAATGFTPAHATRLVFSVQV